MHKDTGEIREMEKVPKEKLGEWSYPFRVGQNVKVFGSSCQKIAGRNSITETLGLEECF